MKPHMSINDEQMFYKYLDKARIYFEFGSGGSTYQASIRKNIEHIYSVESDMSWHKKLKDILKDKKNITFLYNEMDTQTNTWGHPGKNSTKDQLIQYSNQLLLLDESIHKSIDFIMIDGRFRVACCLKCFNVIHDDCFIAFDDFLDRSEYHTVLRYYDIVENTIDKRMVILRKKTNCKIPKELIEKYEVLKN